MLLKTVVLEKTLESFLDCKEIQPVHLKGNQPWIFIGRTDAEAETPILWPPDAKRWLIWKDPDAGKDWGQEEKGMPEDEMVGWHHRLKGHEFGWTLGVVDGQRGLVCCGSWDCSELDMTERLNWIELDYKEIKLVKEINPEYLLEGLMLKLKLQYLGHLMWRTDLLKKTLMLAKIEGRKRGWQRMRWLDDITN